MATKRHHYISKFYLALFADTTAETQKPSIWVFGKEWSAPRLIAAENAAVQTHYYSIQTNDGQKSDIFEQFLAKNESDTAPILAQLCQKDFEITGDDRAKIAVFISLLMQRVPAARDWMEQLFANLSKQRMKVAARTPGVFEDAAREIEASGESLTASAEEIRQFILSDRYVANASPTVSLKMVFHLGPELAKIITDMRWTILKSDEEFITSDNPVIYTDPDRPHGAWGSALLSERVELTFPISPVRCLLATHDMAFYRSVSSLPSRRFSAAVHDYKPQTIFATARPNQVREINRRTVSRATGYVFSSCNTASIRKFVERHFVKTAAATGS
ncbi:MAG: DUF4238 domain-containing protein [Candidatus Acidiferrales bacterium]